MQGDNQKAWGLRPDGQYERLAPGTHGRGATPLRSQEHFIALARRATISNASRSKAVETLLASRNEPRRRKRR
jgi:hypothetical protein